MSILRDAINEFDKSGEMNDEIKETLNMLVSLAKDKETIAITNIENDLKTGKLTDTLTVPITRVVTSKSEYRAKSSNTVDIPGKIADSLSELFSGDEKILKCIADIANAALTAIMSTATGEEAESRTYSVIAEYPAIVRYDFYFWGRNTTAESIRKRIETAFTCVGYKSAVDVTKIDFNTFLALYGPILKSAFGNDPEMLKSMIKEASEIFEMFKNTSASNVDISAETERIVSDSSMIYVPKVQLIKKSPCGIF